MLGKNKKNLFSDNDYKMKDNYDADELVVARLQRICFDDIEFDFSKTKFEETEQKYIFELIKQGKKIKYREIFSGFITDSIDNALKNNNICFDFPYVFGIEKFTSYYPETSGLLLRKLELVWAQDGINYPKEKSRVKINKDHNI